MVCLVDDLVELFMQKDGESLFAALGPRKVTGVVVWYLAYVVGDVGHMGMINKTLSNSASFIDCFLPEAETFDNLLAIRSDSESY